MKYLAVLGRQPKISLAELEALFSNVQQISDNLASFTWTGDGSEGDPAEPLARWGGVEPAGPVQVINRLGGTLKLAIKLGQKPLDFLSNLPDGKITLGISDYSAHASHKSAELQALKFKKILVRHGRSVRVVASKAATLSTATSLHNGLSGQNPRKVELIKVNNDWYRVTGVQDIDAYTKRDQARPARDARVGMLPPKLAQILINLCGPLPLNSRILDPFCGTGVVLQEALLMGYQAYGTDINERMIEYSRKNLEWMINGNLGWPKNTRIANIKGRKDKISDFVAEEAKQCDRISNSSHCEAPEICDSCVFTVMQGDATSLKWLQPISAVACEGYLGQPMSQIPTDIKLKEQKQICSQIVLGFLKNLANQIKPNAPVTIAIPAWLRDDGHYERLEILDQISKLGYNVNNKSREGLIYCREGQIVARDILILRKT